MPMKDSKMTDAWIAKAVANNPFVKLPNGSLRSCPVRLAFAAIIEPYKNRKNDDGSAKNASWGAAILLPPGAEAQIQSIMYPEWYAACKAAHPNNFDANGQPFGLHWPLHPCAEKQQLSGYTPGLQYFDASTNRKPPVVDTANNPIIDPSRAYSGVWAFVCLNVYSYNNKKKGVAFGMQSVMIIQDDDRLEGGGIDPKVAFDGVQLDNTFDPSASFGAPMPGAGAYPPPPMGGVMPAPVAVRQERAEDYI